MVLVVLVVLLGAQRKRNSVGGGEERSTAVARVVGWEVDGGVMECGRVGERRGSEKRWGGGYRGCGREGGWLLMVGVSEWECTNVSTKSQKNLKMGIFLDKFWPTNIKLPFLTQKLTFWLRDCLKINTALHSKSMEMICRIWRREAHYRAWSQTVWPAR